MSANEDNLLSIEKYRRKAAGYDATTGPTSTIRQHCIERLKLRDGDTVVDVGCGTGLSFEPLLQRVGKSGRLIAFEQSPEMHEQARRRADALRSKGWRIDLLQASAEDVRFPAPPNAVLMHYVHDITRTPRALENLLGQWPAGTRIAVAGMKFFPWYLAPLNLLAWLKNRPYNVHAHQMYKPWTLLAAHLEDFEWQPTQWGMGYLGSGRVAQKGQA
jgi:demethylmenaquinone methyltransferase/2-methoxy-6-polyprenyl-1,4-benzoquinol methylase